MKIPRLFFFTFAYKEPSWVVGKLNGFILRKNKLVSWKNPIMISSWYESSFEIELVFTYSIKIMIHLKIKKIAMAFLSFGSCWYGQKNSFSIRLGIIFVFSRKNAFSSPNWQNEGYFCSKMKISPFFFHVNSLLPASHRKIAGWNG